MWTVSFPNVFTFEGVTDTIEKRRNKKKKKSAWTYYSIFIRFPDQAEIL